LVNPKFVRKGQVGDWRNYFSCGEDDNDDGGEEKRWDEWITRNVEDMGIEMVFVPQLGAINGT
jgi:hypothetical protein